MTDTGLMYIGAGLAAIGVGAAALGVGNVYIKPVSVILNS